MIKDTLLSCERMDLMEETLGKQLRKARESAGITVDDAVYRAKMPRSVVEALEADDFGFFTSPLYARSFLRQYSEYIGADVEFWIDSLVPAIMIDGEAVESLIDISEPVAKAVTRQQPKASSGAWAAVWMVATTAGLVWGGVKIFDKFETQLSSKEAEPPKVITETTPEPIPDPAKEEALTQSKENVSTMNPERPKRAIIVNFPEE